MSQNNTTLANRSHILIDKLLERDPHLVSQHTTRQYRYNLQRFEAWRAGRPITKSLVETYAAELQAEGMATRTISQHLSAIRWYARRVVDLVADYGGDEETARHAARVATVENVKGTDKPEEAGRYIEDGEFHALLRACTTDKSPAGLRDACMIALGWSAGLRRDEISNLEIGNLTAKNNSADIALIGKGAKVGVAYVDNGAFALLLDWLTVRGDSPGRLFVRISKKGTLHTDSGLSGEAMRKILNKRSQQAVLAAHVTWHDLRRTFCSNLWAANIDGVTIQKLMRHANINQTSQYDRRQEETRRQAIKVLHVPYRRKFG